MKCRDARKLLSRFLDGVLPPETHRAFLTHVDRCDECRQGLEEAIAAHDALRATGDDDYRVPDDLYGQIMGAVRAAEEHSEIAATRTPAVGSPAFLATCASLLVGAVMFYVVTMHIYAPVVDTAELHLPISPEQLAMARTNTQGAVPGKLTAASVNPEFAMLARTTYPTGGKPPRRVSIRREKPAAPGETRVTLAPPEAASKPPTAPLRSALPAPRPARALERKAEPHVPAAPDSPDVDAIRAEPAPVASDESEDIAADLGTHEPHPDIALVASVHHPDTQPGAQLYGYGADIGSKSHGDAGLRLADQGVVAGLVAGYVVQKYVAERIVDSESTLLMVTTSAPAANTAVTDGTIR